MTDTFAHHFHTDLLIQKKPENKLQQIEKKKKTGDIPVQFCVCSCGT